MELKRLTEHIWYMPFEEERDRPNLGYIRGERFSLAVDAGHSAAHVREFYALLNKENLPLPAITVLTHWHWDHTFHTDDSTLVYVAEDKTLFLGDSAGDDFFTGIRREDLCAKLYGTILRINPEICIEGHWVPVNTEDMLSDLNPR